MRADVLIVGGGIAGASAAYFLAPHLSVVLVERETDFGYHSTGRSAAEWTVVRSLGLKRPIVLFGKPFFDAPPRGFASMPLCRPRGNILFAPPGSEAVAEDFIRDAGPLNPTLCEITVDRALEIVPFLRPDVIGRAFYDPDNGEIDVDALYQGFLRGIRSAGGVTRSGVEFLGADRRGERWHTRIGGDTLDVSIIINAAGAWGDVIAERAGVRPLGLDPRRRTALTFDPGFDVKELPPVDDLSTGFYFKPSGATLMVSPGDVTPSAPCDAQPDEFDVATAVDMFERATTLEIRKLSSRWAGLRTFTTDEYPIAGFAADVSGFFWLVGQGGGGIMSSPGLGEFTATLVRGAPWPARALELGLDASQLSPTRLVTASDPPSEAPLHYR
jgi:D-arginine dehydrogenase